MVAAPQRAQARKSPLLTALGFSHAFFTRRGGVSPAPFDSLNFAVRVGDDRAHVLENELRAAAELGVPVSHLFHASQVHGVDVLVLDGSEQRSDVLQRNADITATTVAQIACGVRTADCVPVLLADTVSGAVAAVHSGWRGTVLGAAKHGVEALRALGADPAHMVAAIGPHIESCCFEAGDDVAAELRGASSCANAIARSDPARGKSWPNLRGIVRAQLEDMGVARAAIDDVAGCTVCDRDTFHSFRRDGARSGRMLSAIVGRGPRSG